MENSVIAPFIRKMEEKDLEQVSRNEAVCFSEPWSLQALTEVLAQDNRIFLVAELEGKVVGHCGVTVILDEGEITNVAVCPEYQGRHIGQRLMEELLRLGRAFGITDFTLEVRAGNRPAIHIYEKMGFRKEGIRKEFYKKPVEDAFIMWKRQEA